MRASSPDTAKSMIMVAGRPFIAWQLEWLAGQGVSEVVLSIGYRGEQIRSFVADGRQFGLRVHCIDEGDRRLGTAGALRFAIDANALDDRFFVLYGDSFLDVSLPSAWTRFDELGAEAMMTVYRNDNHGEVSNVVFDGTSVTHYQKNAVTPPTDMVFVDYGLLHFRRSLVANLVAPETSADLSTVLEDLSVKGRLVGFEATNRFFEIGSPQGLAALEHELRLRSAHQAGS